MFRLGVFCGWVCRGLNGADGELVGLAWPGWRQKWGCRGEAERLAVGFMVMPHDYGCFSSLDARNIARGVLPLGRTMV